MEEKTAIAVIKEQREKIEKLKAQQAKNSKKFKVFTCLFVVIIIVSVVGGTVSGKYIRNHMYDKLVKTIDEGDKESAEKLLSKGYILNNDGGMVAYEKMFLGNTNASVMAQNGKKLICDDSVYQSLNGVFEIVKGDTKETVLDSPVSFINKFADGIIFRDDDTKGLMKYNPANKQIETINDSISFGETLVDNGKVFFINHSDGNSICSLDDRYQVAKFLEGDYEKFAITGKYILCLDSDGAFSVYEKDTKIKTDSMNNISTFIVADKVYAQSGTSVFSFTPDFKNSSLEFKEQGLMKYVGANGIYTVNDDSIILVKDGTPKTIYTGVQICKEIYEISEKQVVFNNVSVNESNVEEELITVDI